MTEKDKKEFTFMSEKVKKKPFYQRKGFIRGCQAATLAIIFGGVAGVTFSVAQPWAKNQFGEPENTEKIVFLPDETEETQPYTEAPKATEPETPETKEQIPQTIVEKKELEMSDYTQLYSKMSAVADEAAKSVVTVTGESSNVDWLNEVIENKVQTSGLVIEIGQSDLFILTEKRTLEGAQRIIVTFRNGDTAEAVIQKQDEVSGLAVVKVPLAEISEETKIGIQKPNLSGTAVVRQGDPVIALGTPVNNSNTVAFGMITSSVEMSAVDGEYRVLTTDVLGSDQGSGILLNLDGRIVGIIAQHVSNDSEQITLTTALDFSDIKDLVAALANNESWTYMGITGTEITGSIAESMEMPRGIYVKGVADDSPAMHAGIQGTDIIVSIAGEEIGTMDEYVKELQKHNPESIVPVGIKRSALDGYVDMEVLVTLGQG